MNVKVPYFIVSNGNKTYWQCRNKDKEERCLARAITDGNNVKKWKGLHNHPSNIFESDVIMENYCYFSK